MTKILVLDQPIGDTLHFVRSCWTEFLSAGPVGSQEYAECSRSMAAPSR